MEWKLFVSQLTGEVYAVKVNKQGLIVGEKHNVTSTIASACVEHLIIKNERVRFKREGKSFELSVKEI